MAAISIACLSKNGGRWARRGPSHHPLSYDAARRLTGAADNRGNSVAYTLDAMGNKVREEVKDATSLS